MEENKGILKRIQEAMMKIFRRKKYKELPSARIENSPKIQEEKIDNISMEEEKNEFKERIANISKNQIDKEIENVSTEEEKKIIDSIENFSFPANLDGFEFISDVVIDENSPRGPYVCYMVNSKNKNIEEGLPICCIQNIDKLRIVENYLNKLKDIKGKYDKDSINEIIENGFTLNNGERFGVTEDYHLSPLLKGIMNAKEENEIITIPIDYVCKIVKGHKIEKSQRLQKIEKEQRKKQEEEEEKKKCYNMIKEYIIQGRPINFDSLNAEQINSLKKYYERIISDIENQAESDEYLDFGIEYITKLSNEIKGDSKYSQILKLYNEIRKEEELKKNTNNINNDEKVDLLVQKGKVNRIIKSLLSKKLNENLDIFNTKNKINEREN